jgi:protocatechuate 3,4-dioxygenase beta subunit
VLFNWLPGFVQRNSRRSRRRPPPRRRPAFDVLETRVVPSWTAVGPGPINSGTTGLTPTPPGGDSVSGRVTSIAANPGNHDIVYVATAGGGIWKTTIATSSPPVWTPLTDQVAGSVDFTGAVALAPQDADHTLYAGTGEGNFSFDSYYGRGVLKTTSADMNGPFTLSNNAGAFDRRIVSRIVVDPLDTTSNIVYAAVNDQGTNTLSGNTGIWKSTNGGTTWVNTTATGISGSVGQQFTDLTVDPTTTGGAAVLYAAIGTPAGNALNGVYRSTNGGASWSLVSLGVSVGTSAGRIALAQSSFNHNRLYVAIATPATATNNGDLYKLLTTTDGGATWIDITASVSPPPPPNFLNGQGDYAIALAVDPGDDKIVYAGGTTDANGKNGIIRGVDSGSNTFTWTDLTGGSGVHGPHNLHHAFAFDKDKRLLDGNDGGIWRLDNTSPITWTDLNGNLQITPVNSVSLDTQANSVAFAASTNDGTERSGGIFNSPTWNAVRGSDDGTVRVDFSSSSVVYHTFAYGSGFFERSDNGGTTWAVKTTGLTIPEASNRYAPFAQDPSTATRLVLGTSQLYETTNKGDNWAVIGTPGSNGWTTNGLIDAVAIPKSDATKVYATLHTTGTPTQERIEAGTKSGGVWTFVERTLPGLATGTVYQDIQVDPENAAIVFVVTSTFTGGGKHVWRSANSGQTWTDITANLPDVPTWAFQLDRRQAGDPTQDIYYVGTDLGVYTSTDQGVSWTAPDASLPHAQATDLDLNSTFGILLAGMHGRGAFAVHNGSIQGTVFNDLNGNGMVTPHPETGEPGLSGWTVYLDLNNNGVLDPKEPFTTTDANGHYVFFNLPLGTYHVREKAPNGTPGFVQTTPNPLDVTISAGTLNPPMNDLGNFFTITISGEKFNDLNGNRQLDSGEPGLSGWVIQLDLNLAGTYTAGTATSNASGNYSFTGLGPGTYRLREVMQGGWSQTLAVNGNLVASSGTNISNQNFGNFHNFTISGKKFNDLNGDTTLNPGEPGLQGWTIFLDLNNDEILDSGDVSTVTDANGNYTFPPQGPGTYHVREVGQAGWMQTAPVNPPNVAGVSGSVQTVNFGNFQLVTLAGTKFNDRNGNGMLDSGEPGLVNWVIDLFLNNGTTPTATATTDASGGFSFPDLGPGTYHIREVAQAGWVQSSPVLNVPVTSGTDQTNLILGNFKQITISGQKFNDMNGDGTLGTGEPGLPGWVIQADRNGAGTFTAGLATTDPNGNYSITALGPGSYRLREVAQAGWMQTLGAADITPALSGTDVSGENFGNFKLLTISGQKFNDLDGNGVQDTGDTGVANWVIKADRNGAGTFAFTATTDANGNYSFPNLTPGTYRIREVPQSGWTQTSTDLPDVVVQSGSDVPGQNIGNFKLITLSGMAFEDKDGNGVMDSGDPVLAGWEIFLDTNGDGTPDGNEPTAITDTGGNYSFPDLGPGTYHVREVVQAGWTQTAPVPPFDLAARSGTDVTVKFGNFQLITLSGQKFNDLSNDGIHDTGEGGLPGFTIFLDRNDNGSLDSGEQATTTDANGDYSLTGVGPGTYKVREVQQVGYRQTTPLLADVPAQSGVDVGGLDIGNYKLIAIRGRKFNDLNADGDGTGDPGLQGWTIFSDLNGNGTLDPGEPSDTTDVNGNYTLFVQPGTHKVREVQQAGWAQTTANPDDLVLTLGSPDVSGIDIGNFRRVNIRGQKFNDLNGDGIKQTGEPGLQGWVITLDLNGTPFASATTDAGGNYSFTNLSFGTYRVREVAQAGWVQTTSDPADILGQSGVDLTLDFGNFNRFTVSGQKYQDTNGNGVLDSGESALSGWQIVLDLPGGGSTTATTTANGTYFFNNLGPGTYQLREVGQAGWVSTTSQPITIVGQSGTNVTENIGNFHTVTISGQKYNDVVGNGVKDGTDTGLSGWQIVLSSLGTTQPDVTTTTDGNGNYSFPNLGPGTYRVREVGQAGWIQTSQQPADIPARSGVDTSGVSFGNFQLITLSGAAYNDLNGSGSRDSGEPGLANWVIDLFQNGGTTPSATTSTDASGNYSFANLGPGTYQVREEPQAGWVQSSANPADVMAHSGVNATGEDFGNFKQVALSGRLFQDTNGNHAEDPGEPGVPGWTIFIDRNGNGVPDTGDLSTTTAADGTYSFANLGPGPHHVRVALPAGWVVSTAAQDVSPTSGQDVTGIDIGVFQTVTISGLRFNDHLGDGVRDPSDEGLPGGTLYLDLNFNGVRDPNEPAVAAGADGTYSFSNLGPGTYRVREQATPGFVQTTPNPGDLIATSGASFPGINFGDFKTITLGGTVFDSTNGNGLLDPGEPGVPGVAIRLTQVNPGFQPEVATTDAAGNYSFTNLGPGLYLLTETVPAGFVSIAISPGPITAQSGVDVNGIDFALFRPVSLSGTVFEDVNGNGVRDANERGLSGFVVQPNFMLGGTVTGSGVTDSTGAYHFEGLVGPGPYIVRLVGRPGFVQTTADPGQILATSGTNATGLDFGVFRQITISGRVFVDQNGDGIEQNTEPGFGGITVNLLGAGGRLLTSAVTAGDGSYAFGGLGPGTYQVVEVKPAGHRLTTSPPGPFTAQSGVNVSGLDFGNLGSVHQSFVVQVYLDLLHRPVDAFGLQVWTAALDQGLAPDQMVRALEKSPEFRMIQINDLYFSLLGRPADPVGLAAGMEILNGVSLFTGVPATYDDVRLMIQTSAEYAQRHGNTNAGFLAGLYQDILGRAVDPTGAAIFGGALAGGASRALVTRLLLESTEAKQRIVQDEFATYLHRFADPAGLGLFANALAGGFSEDDLRAVIIGSPEYFSNL